MTSRRKQQQQKQHHHHHRNIIIIIGIIIILVVTICTLSPLSPFLLPPRSLYAAALPWSATALHFSSPFSLLFFLASSFAAYIPQPPSPLCKIASGWLHHSSIIVLPSIPLQRSVVSLGRSARCPLLGPLAALLRRGCLLALPALTRFLQSRRPFFFFPRRRRFLQRMPTLSSHQQTSLGLRSIDHLA